MAYTTINKSTDYFNTKLYTGNGSTNTAQTGVGFQPDWTWIKERSSTSSHNLTDAVRGANNSLSSNLTSGNAVETQSLISFDSDGFTVGSGGGVNENSQTYASWNWKANGQGSSNTDGSINTTYTSASTTSGFSISQYTGNAVIGATIGHGLGAVPKMIIVKNLSASGDWIVYHEAIGNTKRLRLNTTAAEETNAFWNDTTPTSSVWSVNDNGDGNASGSNYIAYCFAEKTGFSKFGSYTGNGNNNGSFIYTGFKPAFVMFKRTSSTDNWVIIDNRRLGYNELNYGLFPNTSDVEQTSTDFRFDLLSNGFKLRNTSGYTNASGQTYIYAAFAAAPLVGSNNIPANAR